MLQTVAQGAIFGDGNPDNGIEDQRLMPLQGQYNQEQRVALSAVGTVICDGGLRGTATHIKSPLVHPTQAIIVTAAHILFDAKSGKKYASCSYLPKNKRFSAIPFAMVSAHNFDPLSENKIAQSESDIVFVALSRSLQQPALKLNIGQSIGSGRLSLLGYNSSQNQITESVGCEQYSSIQFASEKLLLHDCDARSGASGGPLLLEDKNHQTTQLIAIHGGTLLVNKTDVPSLHLSSQTNSANRDGAVADPERWINQARRVDQSVLLRLQQFAAYLAKGSLGQR
ncbi:MAG: hypothetical protein HOO18_07845 [Porticoccaceae bacterium]|nr:hypothetical protein [Porticoccaceae bacterium]